MQRRKCRPCGRGGRSANRVADKLEFEDGAEDLQYAAEPKLDGAAMRVPVPDGSVCDLIFVASRAGTTEELRQAFIAAAYVSIIFISQWVFDVIILVIVFRRIKRVGG